MSAQTPVSTEPSVQELALTNRRLRELAAHIEVVREQDRSRIAREIHDELGSVLVALKLDLSWLGSRLSDKPDLVGKTQSMRRLIDTAVRELGRIITDLRPSILDHQGLWAAMEWHAHDLLKSAGIEADIDLSGASHVASPDCEKATAAFRIFQEMLSNVVRHSGATKVWIEVSVSQDKLWIVVQDNGCGISSQQQDDRQSFGLIGMRERAGHFGGSVDVERREEGGTSARAELPL